MWRRSLFFTRTFHAITISMCKSFLFLRRFVNHFSKRYVKCNYRLFFEESPFFGKPLNGTPSSSPDVVIRRSEARKHNEGDSKTGKREKSSASTRQSLDDMLEGLAVD